MALWSAPYPHSLRGSHAKKRETPEVKLTSRTPSSGASEVAGRPQGLGYGEPLALPPAVWPRLCPSRWEPGEG